MPEIKNTFLKGKMNQDIDSRLLPNGEYREAINLMISRSEGSTVGEFENLLGNTSIREIGQDNEVVIGHYVDETNNKVYLFATQWNSADGERSVGQEHRIFELSLEAPYDLKVLVTGNFLNFNQSFPITGVNLVEDLLFWTDNLNQPRKINISLANPTTSITPTHYQNEDQISVAKYAPCESIYIMDRVGTRVNGAVSPASTNITLDDSTGVKIGDIMSPFEVLDPVATQWNEKIYVVAINPSTNAGANNIIVSKALTISDGFKVVFDRPTATQKTNLLKSNGITQAIPVSGVINTTSFYLLYPKTGDNSDMIPRIGDIITGPGKTVSDNLTIVSASATFNASAMKWTFVTSKVHGFSNSDIVNVSVNPDYVGDFSGDAKFLEDKFVRFSYRFQFEDNEYSIMAPFTQPVFIPKQYSEFGGGQFTSSEDMDSAYKSTIINWFENNIQNIVLKIPLPYNTAALNISNLLISKIDLLYKESDALSVKVLDTVDMVNIPSGTLPSITFYDALHGQNSAVYYYAYDYSSNKPYKTLNQNQITRVYDRVPIKALSQELISNRIVYGNFVDKHTSPPSLDYSASIGKKRPYFNNVIEYPYHNLKQNRTYQVGVILSDRYGRQSDVVLSSYDDLEGVQGSTVFSEYDVQTDQISNPVIDWLGDCLSIQFDNAIGTGETGGEPGVWSTTNPLGWYSYKVVVKQQEQEYYNVYLPGFVNGLPITESDEENKSSFSVLLGDNINKIPRDLSEVGPTDKEYNSSQTLFIRVNNPSLNNKNAGRPYGIPQKDVGWNKQYYPGFLDQEVLSIQTVRDMEIAAIPFKAGAPAGDYGQVGTLVSGNNTTPVVIGSIPWGTSPGSQPFYNSDLNPFAIKIDTTPNGKRANASTVPTVPGPIGAECFAATSGNNMVNMQPVLSVAETRPVFSLLELFYETSLQGKISTLNSLINAQNPAIIALNSNSANFAESLAPANQIGSNISFITGTGTTITADTLFRNTSHTAVAPVILSAYAQNDVSQSNNVASLFQLVYSGNNTGYVLKSAAGQYFTYTQSSLDSPSSGIYNITFQTVYTPGAIGTTTYTDTTTYTATLTNVAPAWTNQPATTPVGGYYPLPTSNPITIASTTIYTFTGINGTNTGNTAQQEALGIVWDLDPSNASSILNGFTMSSSGVLTANTNTLVDSSTYQIIARVRDVGGNGLATQCKIKFTVGTQHVPRAICNGRQGSAVAVCNESYEAFFGASNSTNQAQVSGSYPLSIGGVAYPGNDIKFYNVRANAAAGSTTGALTQGVMSITPNLVRTGAGSVSCFATIQYRANSNSAWSQAVDTGNNTIQNLQLNASNGAPGTVTKNFSIAGEYRVFTTNVSGEGCGSGTVQLYVNFGDATYGNGSCNQGPL